MSEHQPAREAAASELSTAAFEALYQGRGASLAVGGPRLEVIPWQLDGPQPIIAELADAGEISGPVLECGCGLGDNALFLAERGYSVTAFDASVTAIEQDRAKAAERGLPVTFTVADATTLDGIDGAFRTVIDCAMLHCLDTSQRRAYLAGLRRVCAPGARLHVLCFTDLFAGAFPLPAPLDHASLRQDLSQGWRIERFQPRLYTTGLTPHQWREQLPSVVLPMDLQAAGSVDDHNRVLLPIWQITATRT